MKEAKVDCPKCDGYGFEGVEEDSGKPFSCYFCGESGKVLKSVADELHASYGWAAYLRAEKKIEERILYGVPHGCRYFIDEYDGEVILIPPKIVKSSDPYDDLLFDDIPF